MTLSSMPEKPTPPVPVPVPAAAPPKEAKRKTKAVAKKDAAETKAAKKTVKGKYRLQF